MTDKNLIFSNVDRGIMINNNINQHLDLKVEESFRPSLVPELQQWLFNKGIKGSKVLDRVGNQTRTIHQGRSYLFDGTDDYVLLDNLITFSGEFTLSYWQLRLDNNFRMVLGPSVNSNTQKFGLGNSNNFFIRVVDGGSSDTTLPAPNTGVWQHVIITRDSANKIDVYRDNGSASRIFSNDAQAGDCNLRVIGTVAAPTTGFTQFWNGRLFDVRLFNRQVSSTERTKIYNFEPVISGCVGWYKMDEQDTVANTTCYDSMGGTNNGTITNATLSTFQSTQNIYSFQNEVGYNLSGTVYIPRDESDITKDVLGNNLVNTGRVKYNADLVESNRFSGNGAGARIDYGDNNAFSFTDGLGNDLPFSIAMRIKIISMPSTHYIMSKFNTATGVDREWQVRIQAENIYIRLSNFDIFHYIGRRTDSLETDKDYDVVITYNGNKSNEGCQIYLNKVRSDIANSSTGTYNGMSRTTATMCIASGQGGSNAANVQVNDVRLFSSVLSTADINDYTDNKGDNMSVSPYFHVPLSEGAGIKSYDISGNNYHGDIIGITEADAWANKQNDYHYNITKGFNKYMHFMTPNKFVTVADADALSFTDGLGNDLPFSISAWFYAENLSSTRAVCFKWNSTAGQREYGFTVGTTGILSARIVGNLDGTIQIGRQSGASAVLPGKLHHLMWVYDGSKTSGGMKTYVDGQRVDTTDWNVGTYLGAVNSTADFSIGNFTTAGNVNQQGLIFDFAIFGEDLTDEVTNIFTKIKTPDEYTSCIAYWLGYGNTNADWVDQVGTYDGTVTGSPTNIRIPKVNSNDAVGVNVRNPAGNWHNDAETKISQALAPALIQTDILTTKNFWFDATPTAKKIGYSDIVSDVATGDEKRIIMSDVSIINKKKNILTFSNALSGQNLTDVRTFLNTPK